MPRQSVGRFTIVSPLGKGGMGEVFLARDTQLERLLALKILPEEFARDELRRQRFMTEAKAASALNHPNVCVVYEVGETEDQRPYIAMEYLKGAMLEEKLQGGGLHLAEILEVAIQIADALSAAHVSGIVHRDLKPSNISLNEQGRVKVLDFGLAKISGPAASTTSAAPTQVQTRTGQILGTPVYMSPEQALGKPVDGRSDLFSLGILLYQMTTGRLPFEGQNFGEILDKIIHAQPPAVARFNYDAPAELERVIRKCLEKETNRRYQVAQEVLVDLKNLQRDLQSGDFRIRGSESAPVANAAHAAPREVPSLEVLTQSGIYLSYAPIDDVTLEEGRQGWISLFHRNLEIRLQQLTGEEVRIFRDPAADDTVPNERVIRYLPEIRALVSVVSPTFVRSDRCRREVEAFLSSSMRVIPPATAHPGEDELRVHQVFSALKAPVPAGPLPFVMSHLLAHRKSVEFFERDPETGRIRELDEAFGEHLRRRYHERIYDLAYELSDSLMARPAVPADPSGAGEKPGRQHVYLAEVTSDLLEAYAVVRRELLALGHAVLPDKPLPTEAEELRRAVTTCLQAADFSVHLVGGNYGLIPENAMVSVSELQFQLAAQRSRESELRRLIWMPRELSPTDPRQQEFVRRLLEEDAQQSESEILKVNLSSFKEVLETRLRAQEKPSAPAVESAQVGALAPGRIYLICDREDEEALEGLEDFLFEKGLEVSRPDFGADPDVAIRLHQSNLVDCEAVLIYYGQGRHAWAEMQLRDILKANGYGRKAPWRACGVFIGPPLDRRKERFRSHIAQVLHSPVGPFTPFPELEAFAARAMGISP